MSDRFVPQNVDEADIDAIENDVGVGAGGWDCAKPQEIVAAAWNRLLEKHAEVMATDDLLAAIDALLERHNRDDAVSDPLWDAARAAAAKARGTDDQA